MTIAAQNRAIKIFFSFNIFAARDRKLFEELMKQLSPMEEPYMIKQCYDSAISAGKDSDTVIEALLNTADIIVLLISADFFASKRCRDIEMERALQLSTSGRARLIPVILRDVNWKVSALHRYSALPPNEKPVRSWRNVDKALSEVAKGIQQVVEELAGRMKKWTMRGEADRVQLPFYHLPLRYNGLFTDREQVLNTLNAFFRDADEQAVPVLALNGLSGMGKTQIALAYIQQASNRYDIVLWLDASSREQLAMQVSELANEILLPQEEREQDLFAAIKQWLQEQQRWLLVLDHIDDMALVNLIMPERCTGHLLLTTQQLAVGTMATAVSIGQMETDQSVQFLLRRAKLPSVHAKTDEVIEQAKAIVREMGGLPLGLDQAGAYIEETGCSFAAYLELYRAERVALLKRRGQVVDRHDHPQPAAVTLALACEKVAQRRTEHIDLLYLLAFLHSDAIPDSLLEQGAKQIHEPLRSVLASRLYFQKALSDLLSFSLIQRSADRMTMSIHPLVQIVLIEGLTKKQRREWATQVVSMVNAVFPEAVFEYWAACERYVEQAQHCARLIRDYQLTLKEGASLLQRLGDYCYQRTCYDEAEGYLKQALQVHEQQRTVDIAAQAELFNALGLIYYRQGEFQGAEEFHQRALALREQEFGPEHVITAESLHNLAVLYGSQGRYQQAEQLYQHVLVIDQKEWGEEHAETAKTLNNVGLMRYLQGDYSQAEEYYQRALVVYERVASDDAPELTYTLNSLGALYEKQKDYGRAEEFYQKALTIREQVMGEQHPDTAYSMNKVADIYEAQGKYRQAEELYRRALEIDEHALGEEHADVALLLNNLAFLAYEQGHYEQAEPMYQRALSIYERAFDEEHATIASVLRNLGQLYQSTKEWERAESFLRRALAMRQKTLGEGHPDTIQSTRDMEELLSARHEDEEARKKRADDEQADNGE